MRPGKAAAKVVSVGLLAGLTGSAWSHDWYSKHYNPVTNAHCCGTSDCKIVPDHEIHMTRFSYIHLPTKLAIPRGQALISRDEHFHVCIIPNATELDRFLCIFVPPGKGS